MSKWAYVKEDFTQMINFDKVRYVEIKKHRDSAELVFTFDNGDDKSYYFENGHDEALEFMKSLF